MRAGVAGSLVEADAGDRAGHVDVELDPQLDRASSRSNEATAGVAAGPQMVSVAVADDGRQW